MVAPPRGKAEGGPPHPEHERRCGGKSRVTGEQCKRWALRGEERCQFHGGRIGRGGRWGGYTRVYGKHLKGTLKKRLHDLVSCSHEEQVQLYEELAVARAVALEAVTLLEPLVEHPEKTDVSTRALAVSCVREAITVVRDMALAVSRIEKDSEDKVSIHVLDLFVLQILKSIYRACGDDKDLAERIEAEVEFSVRMPDPSAGNLGVRGTTITPDQVVREMDDTVGGHDGECDS